MKYIFFLILLSLISKANGQSSYINAFNSICKNDYYQCDSMIIKPNKYNVYISDEVIPINLMAVASSVLSINFIEGYNDFSNYKDEQIKLIDRVIDSLTYKEKELNRDFVKHRNSKLKNITKNRDYKFVVYFSEIVENVLYAELFSFNPLICDNYNRECNAVGKAYCFLFVFNEENEIIETYTGEIYYD